MWMSTDTLPAYPVRVEGHLDPGLSRWLWLVKWLLVIPHYIVLMFLWTAFVVLSVVAFFAILFTGRYPRGIFDFNVGVLRWSWRVAFYAFAANGTDRYPPFALGETDYPATLSIEYPGRLSRGLVLVKWWLLAIPHYVVVAVFVGSGAWFATRADEDLIAGWGGLISVLVLIAVVVLLFTGRYPRGIFDLVLGMNRWVIRVAAYAGLMTDRYPPFRLDLGENEPETMTVPPAGGAHAASVGRAPAHAAGAPAGAAGAPTGAAGAPTGAASGPAGAARAPARAAGGGRVALLVIGSVMALIATGLLAGGGVSLVYDQTQRDSQGFLMTDAEAFSTGSYALVTEDVEADFNGPDWVPAGLLDEVKLRSDSAQRVFIGIGPAAAVERYLAGVPRDELRGLGDTQTPLRGTRAPAAPEAQTFWVARATGSGEQAIRWNVRDGNWRAVVMAAGGSRGVDADLAVGATVPDLDWIAGGLLAGGALLLLAGGALIFAGARGLGTDSA
jgi:hypothetical protein